MDEDGNEPVKPSLEVCAGDGMLAIIVSSFPHIHVYSLYSIPFL